MGSAFSLIAIKGTSKEPILDVVRDYYQRFDLELVEEKMGIDGEYKDILEYKTAREKDRLPFPEKPGYSTRFGYYTNLSENEGWSILFYNTREARNTLDIDADLSRLLSERLKTTVVEYLQQDATCSVFLRVWEGGEVTGKFLAGDMRVEMAEGMFGDLTDREFGNYDEVFELIRPYAGQLGFNPWAEELETNDIKTWSPMYLRGTDQKIQEFFRGFQLVF